MALTVTASIPALALLVAQFDATALTPAIRDRFQNEAAQLSPVDRFANIAELLYANAAGVDATAWTLGAQCAHICRLNGWHSLADPRGYGIVQAFSRDLGETPPTGTTWPDPADDPAADANWTA